MVRLSARLGLIAALSVGCGASPLVSPDALPQEAAIPDIDTDTDTDGPACCPPDPGPIFGGCVHLGGMNRYQCHAVCDFWCSTNWRLERGEGGCEVWRMDYRTPAPGENNLCFPDHDAGRG